MPRRSPFTSVTPALSIATSVPVPIAMPTSACASAGASLMPSPAIATTRPSACSRSTTRGLLVGQHLGDAPRRCRACARRRRAVVRLSPVSMTMRRPSRRSAASASGVVALIGSATPSRPAARPSTATNITVCAVAAAALGAAVSDSSSRRRCRDPRAARDCRARPRARRPCRARPCRSPTRSRRPLRGATPRSRAPATIAAASGCSLAALEARGERAAARASSMAAGRLDRDAAAACPR